MNRAGGFIAAGLAFMLMGADAGHAAEPILEIVGRDGVSVHLDADMLAALPQHEIVTHTSVTDGPQVFVGPLMRDIMAEAGVEAETVLAIALNDYEVPIPTEDFERFDVIAATVMNGEVMTSRDKGPIWIIYPRDDYPELNDIRFDARWVWQLSRLEVQ